MKTYIKETKTKNGRVSAYGFACGYFERSTNHFTKDGKEVTKSKELYKEHGAYHVRSWINLKRDIWEVRERLKDARKLYNSIVIHSRKETKK